jgi:hypothetical protein
MPGRMRSYTSYEEEDGILVPSIEPTIFIQIVKIPITEPKKSTQ